MTDPLHQPAADLAEIMRLDQAVRQRFWSKVQKPRAAGDCWRWVGGRTGAGYGAFSIRRDGRTGTWLAHRVTYEALVGPIPPGEFIDHRCRRRWCVNPSHLQATSNKRNQENRSGPPSNNTSGLRGVHWDPDHKKWRVSVRHNGKRHYGGYFDDLAEAGRVVVALRNTLHTNNLADREAM